MTKTILNTIIGVLFFFLILIGGSYVGAKQDKKRLMSNLEISRDSVKYERNKYGQTVASKRVLAITLKELKDQGEILGLDNKKLKEQVGNLNNLVNRLEGDLVASGSGNTVIRDTVVIVKNEVGQIIQVDSAKVFNWTNNYLTLGGTLIKKDLSLYYLYQTSFDLTTYNKKAGFLKKKQLVADITFEDPGARAMNIIALQIEQPRKPFYTKWWFHMSVGATGMYFIMK